jgi:CBS domain containing-hemolysin-like protein
LSRPEESRISPLSSGLTLALLAGLSLLLRFAFAQESETMPPSTPQTPGNPWFLFALGLGTVFLLTVVRGLFSVAETALVTVRRSRLEQLIEEKRRGAHTALRLVENPARYAATVQMGVTLMGFASAAVAAATIVELMELSLIPISSADIGLKGLCLAGVTLLVFLLSMVLGEIAPKAVALNAPDQWLMRVAPFIHISSFLFSPLASVVVGLAGVLVAPFGAKARFETPLITREELKQKTDEGKQHGEIDDEEAKIVTNVFDLSETPVRSVMTPRIDMTALPLDSSMERILETVMESGHSRIPVYENTVDNIVGIVHAKDLLPHLRADSGTINLKKVMRRPYFVPESKRISELLTELRRDKQQLAIVQDEYAGTEGIVTIEDLLEEIVGEIRDEYDVDEPDIQTISGNEAIIDGRMAIADVNERLGLDLPNQDYNTIGGLIFGELGHEPALGERLRIAEMEFQIEQIVGRSIRLIRAVRVPTEIEESAWETEESGSL